MLHNTEFNPESANIIGKKSYFETVSIYSDETPPPNLRSIEIHLSHPENANIIGKKSYIETVYIFR